jgi:hypothetical protein
MRRSKEWTLSCYADVDRWPAKAVAVRFNRGSVPPSTTSSLSPATPVLVVRHPLESAGAALLVEARDDDVFAWLLANGVTVDAPHVGPRNPP